MFLILVSINTVYADEEFNTQSEALKVARKLYESFDQELLEQSIYPDDFAIVSIDNPYFVSSNVIRYKKTNFDVSKQEINIHKLDSIVQNMVIQVNMQNFKL